MKRVFKFHNNIKRKYINKYAGKKLLDLASGRGGDLDKWVKNKKIKKVVGYDINENSVKEAIKRLGKIKRLNKDISFYVKDLSNRVLNCNEKFDTITCQFAFHYFFKNPKTLNTILSSIKNCSKNGTIFICTLFDGDLIKSDFIYPEFEIKKISKDSRAEYNNKISVYIKDSILNVPEIEYLVRPKFLIKKLSSIHFELIETKSFKSFSEDELSETEKIFSGLNKIYIFRKI